MSAPDETDAPGEASAPGEATAPDETDTPDGASATHEASAPTEASGIDEASAPAKADVTHEASAPSEAVATHAASAPTEADATNQAATPDGADEADATDEASTGEASTDEASTDEAADDARTSEQTDATDDATAPADVNAAGGTDPPDEGGAAGETATQEKDSAGESATQDEGGADGDVGALDEVGVAGGRGAAVAAVALERHFRRLLLAYPRDYRERRAEEMLATLLDDAAPGQLRPTWGEVGDLLVGGARQRLRLPWLPGVWVAAVLSALIIGAVTAAGAASIGWIPAGPLPDNNTATRLVTSAFTPRPGTVTTRFEPAFGYEAPARPTDRLFRLALGDDTFTAGYVQVAGYPGEEHSLDDAADALRWAGWHVNALREDSDGSTLTASMDGLTLRAQQRSTDNKLVVVIRRAPPAAVVPLTVFGWLAGAIAGWVFAGALARRAGQQLPNVGLLMQAAVIAGLMSAMPATILTTMALANAMVDPPSSWESPLWAAYMYPILRPLALSGIVFAIAAAGLATFASPGERAPATQRSSAAHGIVPLT